MNPNDSVTWVDLGKAYKNKQNYQEDIKCQEKAIELSPNYTNALAETGYAYYKLNQLEKAEEYFKKAMESNPSSATPLWRKAEALAEAKKVDESVECLEKIAKMGSSTVKLWTSLGEGYRLQKKYTESLEALNKALTINPKSYYAHKILGDVYCELENLEKSVEELHIAADLRKSKDAWLDWLNIGRTYHALKRYSEAMEAFNKSLSILETHKQDFENETYENNRGTIHYWLGRIYLSENKLSLAEEFILKALEVRPKSYHFNFYLGETYYKQKNLSSAEKYLKKAYELADDKQKIACLNFMLVILYAQTRYDEGIDYLKELIKTRNDDYNLWLMLGLFYRRNRQFSEAIGAYNKALELTKNDKQRDRVLPGLEAAKAGNADVVKINPE